MELGGKTATGMRVPPQVVEGLGAGRKPAVRVTINDDSYQSTIAVRGGAYLIPISAQHRSGAGVVAGDEVDVDIDVDIEVDTEVREVTVPPDFATALAEDAAAQGFFDGLSYSQRQWFVTGIEDAKTAETRTRRITAAVERLRAGRGQR